MLLSFTQSLLDEFGKPVYIVPCTVTATSPLVVTLLGQTGIPAVSIAGASYSLGAANALLTSPGKPIILPIGP